MGLNVDPSNCTSSYKPAPPQPTVMTVSWVNRPTENLMDENSNVNKLFNTYKDTLPLKQKANVDKEWNQHVTNAKNGEPKLSREEFRDNHRQFSEQSFKDLEREFKDARHGQGENNNINLNNLSQENQSNKIDLNNAVDDSVPISFGNTQTIQPSANVNIGNKQEIQR